MKASYGAAMRWSQLPHPIRVLIAILVAVSLAAYALVAGGRVAHAAPALLSQGKSATASSANAGNAAAAAVDGDTGTRWESA